jgi:PAS domain S-box-containing protein
MAKKPGGSTKIMALRRQAEEALRASRRDVAAMPVQDVQRLVHELQVHQIELEMQNDELRRAQVELEVARDRYVELYDYAPVGYLTLDLKGMILEANLKACTLLGITWKDLLGQPATRFVATKDHATFLRHLRELFDTGISQACEVDLAQQNDAPVSVRFESVAVPDGSGRRTRVLGALLDITERRCAAATMREYQQGLERQRNLEERERIGHDLHDGILQSLFAIGLGLEAGKLDLSEAPDKAEALLARSIGELNSVMREVRTFIEKLEAGTVPKPAPPALDLSTSLRTMANTLAQFHGRQVRVSVDNAVATGMSHVQGPEILNLVKEALSNSFRHAKATLVQVSLRRLTNTIRLTVQDNGTGLRRKGATGGGQGLISMAARAHRLGGTLAVQSRPAQGTRVVLDLPKKNCMEDAKP